MGLEMYLYAERYAGGWDHARKSESERDRNEVRLFDRLVESTGITPTPESPSFTVQATIGYWRKANAIHRWFVETVQDGKDECQKSYVERDQLAALRDLCNQVLSTVETVEGDIHTCTTYSAAGVEKEYERGPVVAQQGIAEKMLPSGSGFFFGSTDYNEYYLEDLRNTVEMIDGVLGNPALEGCDFYYHASW